MSNGKPTDARGDWLAGLEWDGLHVGLNWAGKNARGYDLPPGDVLRALAARERNAP